MLAALAAAIGLVVLPAAAFAQNAESEADRQIQQVLDQARARTDLRDPRCLFSHRSADQIVVCAAPDRDRDRLPLYQKELEARIHDSTPRAPDLFGLTPFAGFGPTVTFKGCFIPPCPPRPIYYFDIASLPQAPAGSDAARIAAGEIATP